jgi:hypothetical protein
LAALRNLTGNCFPLNPVSSEEVEGGDVILPNAMLISDVELAEVD